MTTVEKITAKKDTILILDPEGFFVINLDRENGDIIVEHYTNVSKDEGKGSGKGSERVSTGKLNKVIVGADAHSIVQTIAREGLVSRLDHSAYLGMELYKAEQALKDGSKYEQS